MMSAAARGRTGLPIIDRGTDTQPDARTAGDATNDAHQHRRREHAAMQIKARRKVGDINHIAGLILYPCQQDRGIALIDLPYRMAILENQIDESEGIGSMILFIGAQQAAAQAASGQPRPGHPPMHSLVCSSAL